MQNSKEKSREKTFLGRFRVSFKSPSLKPRLFRGHSFQTWCDRTTTDNLELFDNLYPLSSSSDKSMPFPQESWHEIESICNQAVPTWLCFASNLGPQFLHVEKNSCCIFYFTSVILWNRICKPQRNKPASKWTIFIYSLCDTCSLALCSNCTYSGSKSGDKSFLSLLLPENKAVQKGTV